MRQINLIVIHCAATKEGAYFNTEDIDRWHRARGFAQIGYHYVIGLKGEVWRGRDEREIGAHVLGYNRNSIGVCYIGGLDKYGKPKDTRTPAQKRALLTLLRELKKRYPNAVIKGHRDFANKTCPCFNAAQEYKNL